MVGIITGNAMPQTFDEVSPGAKPIDACERDFTLEIELTDGRKTMVQRRLRIVRLVSADQTKLHKAVKDMGPATGEDGVFIPCDEVVEMAHIHELLDHAVEKRRARERARALLLPVRTASMREALMIGALEQMERKAGRSVSGPFLSTERVSY